MTDIKHWLQGLGLEKYVAVFAEHEITLEVLPDLTESDIDRLALPTGTRRRIMVAIQAFAAGARAQPSVESPQTPVVQPTHSRDAERRQLTVMFCDLVQHLNLLTYALTVNALALHRHGSGSSDPPAAAAAV